MYIYVYTCMYIIYLYMHCMYALSKGHVGMLLSPYFRGACLAICFTYVITRGIAKSDNEAYNSTYIFLYINPLKFIV